MTDNNINTELNFEDDSILNEGVENAASQIDNTQTAVDAGDNTSIDERENVLYLTKIIPELILKNNIPKMNSLLAITIEG
jgi:hypothetical protein